jgi:O-antigen/teichoic acid export membrane protein
MGVSSVASNLIMLRFLVRYLPQKEAGVWLLFLTLSSYLVVFDFGISPTIGREISFAVGETGISDSERARRVRNLLATGSRLLQGLAVGLAIVCGIAGYFYLGSVVDFHSALGHETALSWTIFVLAVAASVSGEIWMAALYGMGSVVTERLLRTAGYVIWIALSIVILRSGGGLKGLSLAWFYAFGIRLAARAMFFNSQPQFRPTQSRIDWELGKALSGKSLKYAGTLIGGTLILYTDNIVIASVLGPARVPNYYAVARLVSACLAVAMLISTASSPFISAAYAAGRMDEVRRITMRNVQVSLALMGAGGSFLAFFGRPLILSWIGEGNFVGFGVLIVMLCAMTLEAHHVTLATATMACGEIPFFAPALIAGFLNLAFSFPLAHRFGLVGVALGTLLAQITTNNWFIPFYSLRHLHIRFQDYCLRVLIPCIALIAFFIGCSFLAAEATHSRSRLMQIGTGFLLNGGILLGIAIAWRWFMGRGPRTRRAASAA